MATVEQSRQVSPENLFPKDVLPTVGFLSKLPGLGDLNGDRIRSWGGKALVNGSELTIGASFQSKMSRIDHCGGIKPFNGREIHISVSKHIGDNVDDIIEYWTLFEDPKNNQLIAFVSPCYSSSMLLPDAKSHMLLVLGGKLAVAKGKLDNADGFLTEEDIDRKKSHANYWYYQKKVAPVSLEEIFEAMGALKNAILSARPTED